MKAQIKSLIKKLPFDFTRNQKYDRETKKIIRRVCRPGSNCIDVGCHKGEILDFIKKTSPHGIHYGFEPIPELFENLKRKYQNTNCRIYQLAISNRKGQSSFNYVVSNPSYSGLKKRKYDRPAERDMQIMVDTDTIDNIIPDIKIDFVKVDVEGAEILVFEGARKMLATYKPVVVFEYGIGGSDFYGADPEKMFGLLNSLGLNISLLEKWLRKEPPLTFNEFAKQYYEKLNFVFIAY